MKSITAVIGLRDSHVSYGKRSRTYEQSDLWDSRVSICYDFFLATSNCTCTSDLHHVSHESVIAQLGLALAWMELGREGCQANLQRTALPQHLTPRKQEREPDGTDDGNNAAATAGAVAGAGEGISL